MTEHCLRHRSVVAAEEVLKAQLRCTLHWLPGHHAKKKLNEGAAMVAHIIIIIIS